MTHSTVCNLMLSIACICSVPYMDFTTITVCGECCIECCVGCKKKEDGICRGCIESDGHCVEYLRIQNTDISHNHDRYSNAGGLYFSVPRLNIFMDVSTLFRISTSLPRGADILNQIFPPFRDSFAHFPLMYRWMQTREVTVQVRPWVSQMPQ